MHVQGTGGAMCRCMCARDGACMLALVWTILCLPVGAVCLRCCLWLVEVVARVVALRRPAGCGM